MWLGHCCFCPLLVCGGDGVCSFCHEEAVLRQSWGVLQGLSVT